MYVCPLADVHHGRPRGTGVEGCWMEWSSSALRNNKSCPRRGRRQGSLIERAWPTGKEPGRAEATIGLWLSPTHPGLAVSFPFSLLAAVSSPGLADISSSYRFMACPGTSSERIARRLRPMANMLGLTVTLLGSRHGVSRQGSAPLSVVSLSFLLVIHSLLPQSHRGTLRQLSQHQVKAKSGRKAQLDVGYRAPTSGCARPRRFPLHGARMARTLFCPCDPCLCLCIMLPRPRIDPRHEKRNKKKVRRAYP